MGRVLASTCILLLILPVLMVALYSLNSSNLISGEWSGFSLGSYEMLLKDSHFWNAVKNSALIALISTLFSTSLGTFAALGFRYSEKQSKAWILIALPCTIPPILIGFAAAALAASIDQSGSVLLLATIHTAYLIPFAFGVARLGTLSVERDWVLCATNFGASSSLIIKSIVLPTMLPFVLGAACLCFFLSWEEVVIARFLSGFEETLPIYIWNRLRSGFRAEVLAAMTLGSGVSGGGLVALACLLVFARNIRR